MALSIKELLQASKDVRVKADQITKLKNLLEEQGRQEYKISSDLLLRTYRI